MEDAHHATVVCTKATALRHQMRKVWSLPSEHLFRYSGKDWLLVLLSQLDNNTSSNVLLLLWRAWHLRNDIIHQHGRESIAHSAAFLESYCSGHLMLNSAPDDTKGKGPLFVDSLAPHNMNEHAKPLIWSAPETGWIKLNTDASFINEGLPGGAGAVVRDACGGLLLAACSPIVSCRSAEEAEALAALKGIQLLVGLGFQKVVLEMDCANVAAALRSGSPDRSSLWTVYDETKKLLKSFEDFSICCVRREKNRVANALAKLARSAGSCIWTCDPPDAVQDLVNRDSLSAML